MKKLNSGDTLIFPNGKRVTVRNVREGANGEMFCDFHEISCDWTVHQLSVMGCFDDVLTRQWRDANRYRNSVVSGQTDEFKSFDMADIAIGLLNQMTTDRSIDAGTPHNWVEVSDEPAKKICVRNNDWSRLFESGREYEYTETGDKEFETQLDIAAKRGFKIDAPATKMVKDKEGNWHRYLDFAFYENFTVKQPKRTDWQPPGPPEYKGY